jgi:uncharacterized membrane protein
VDHEHGGDHASGMSNLIVMTFEHEQDAAEVLATIRRLEHERVLKLADSAVVAKDLSGNVSVRNEVSSATEVGATTGAVLGGFLTLMFPPIGMAIGAASGAAIGAMLQKGVDSGVVNEVSASLQPGGSALFLVTNWGHPSAIEALKPFKGTVYQTTLPEDIEDRLRRALA